eukprot:4251037-Amphidinium_carterae.1
MSVQDGLGRVAKPTQMLPSRSQLSMPASQLALVYQVPLCTWPSPVEKACQCRRQFSYVP